MIAMVKLTRNGNGTMITIPKALVGFLNWNPGEHVAIAVHENKTLSVIRVDVPSLLRAASVQMTLPANDGAGRDPFGRLLPRAEDAIAEEPALAR